MECVNAARVAPETASSLPRDIRWRVTTTTSASNTSNTAIIFQSWFSPLRFGWSTFEEYTAGARVHVLRGSDLFRTPAYAFICFRERSRANCNRERKRETQSERSFHYFSFFSFLFFFFAYANPLLYLKFLLPTACLRSTIYSINDKEQKLSGKRSNEETLFYDWIKKRIASKPHAVLHLCASRVNPNDRGTDKRGTFRLRTIVCRLVDGETKYTSMH